MCSSIDHTHLPINWSDILPLWESESLPSGHVWSDLPLPFTPFDIHVTVHRKKFLYNKPTRCTNFSNLFWKVTLHVSNSSPVHQQEFFTVHTAMAHVIQVMLTACERYQDVPFWSRSQCVSKTSMTYTIAVCTVKNSWWWTEELSKTCRVSFRNKFEKLVHLVGLL